MKSVYVYSIVAAVVIAASGGAFMRHEHAKGVESCFIRVQHHLARPLRNCNFR